MRQAPYSSSGLISICSIPTPLETTEDFIKRACSDLAFMEKQLKEEPGEKGCCFSISYGAYTPELLEAGKPKFQRRTAAKEA